MREQKSERRRSINASMNGAGQVSMRGGQERNVANETVEIGFVGLGHMGTTMAGGLLAAGFKVLCFVRRPKRALTSQVAIAAGVAERRPRTGTS